MHSILPYSITLTSSELYQIRPSAMLADATIFIYRLPTIPHAQNLAMFSTFSTFQYFDSSIPSHTIYQHYLTFSSPKHLSSLPMAYRRHRSLYSQVIPYIIAPISPSLEIGLPEKES